MSAVRIHAGAVPAMPARPALARGGGVSAFAGSPFATQLRATGLADRAGQAREAAEKLVSSAFIEPALAMLREGADLDPPFAPGPAEQRFGPLLDQYVADRVVHGANFPLVDAITERLLAKEAPGLGPDAVLAGTGDVA